MPEDYQIKPLSPSSHQTRSDEQNEESTSTAQPNKARQRKHKTKLLWGSIIGTLILAVLIIILILTVFRVKAPEVKVNQMRFPQLSLNTTVPPTVRIVAEVAVKNPNIASFVYDNSTTSLYYNGNIVGEGPVPAGRSKARRTRNMTLSIDVSTAKVLADSKFLTQFGSGVLTVSSYTRLDGRVRIIRIIKKHVVVKINCTVTSNITSHELLDQNCERHVSL